MRLQETQGLVCDPDEDRFLLGPPPSCNFLDVAFDDLASVTTVSFGQCVSRIAVPSAAEEVRSFADDIIAHSIESVIDKSQRWPAITEKDGDKKVATECRGCAANPTWDR